MAEIAERGRLIVGVDQNTNLFGFRNPATGQLEGFDIDIAREIARAIFGDPDRIELRVVNAGQRESALQSGQVDVVVRTYSITCDRKEIVAFSTMYFNANQKILAVKGSGIDSAAALSGKRVCAVSGTTSLSKLFALDPPADDVRRDHLDRLPGDAAAGPGRRDQHRRRGAAGLAQQDPNVEVVGDSIAIEPYGVGVKQGERGPGPIRQRCSRADARGRHVGTALRQPGCEELGPSPGPPQPRYQD